MNLRRLFILLGIAVFATATAADAVVHKVSPGESIQSALDAASPGDTVLVEPGTYQETGNAKYGLHITTDNIRLIGKVKKGRGDAGKVRVLKIGTQQTGVYAAPAGCEFNDHADTCTAPNLEGFYVRGFSVEGFPKNGIQTRWVNDFKIIRNESINNLNNGLYPTLSVGGLVQNNVSYGSLDTALWVAGSENVRVIGNELYGSPIGFEITVSNDVWATHNDIHDNTVGVGLFHPEAAGNPPLPVMANWVIEHNNIYDNNLPNPAPPGSFQADVPPGVGILMLGISDHVIGKNTIENNDYVGIAVLGWCTAMSTIPGRMCDGSPIPDPRVNNNLIYQNEVTGNGGSPPGGPLDFLAADISYFEFEGSSGNCFEKNDYDTAVSSEGTLPTDGC